MSLFNTEKHEESNKEEHNISEEDFLESEITEDDETAPMGILVRLPNDEESTSEIKNEDTLEESVNENINEESKNDEQFILSNEEPIIEEKELIEENIVEEPIIFEEPKVELAVKEISNTPENTYEEISEYSEPIRENKTEIKTYGNDAFENQTANQIVSYDYKEAIDAQKERKKNPTNTTKKQTPKKSEKEIWGKVVFEKKEDTAVSEIKNPIQKKKDSTKKTITTDIAKEKKDNVKVEETKTVVSSKKTTKEVSLNTKVKKQVPKQEQNKNTNKKEDKEMAEEKIIQAGDNSIPHGKFVIRKTDKDNFVFKLISSNKRVVAIGAEAYAGLPGAKGGISSVMKNAATAPIENQTLKKVEELKFPKWVIYKDKKGEFRLRLYATNGNIVATTNDGYTSADGAKKGIDAIARACIGAEIVRNDDPKAY